MSRVATPHNNEKSWTVNINMTVAIPAPRAMANVKAEARANDAVPAG